MAVTANMSSHFRWNSIYVCSTLSRVLSLPKSTRLSPFISRTWLYNFRRDTLLPRAGFFRQTEDRIGDHFTDPRMWELRHCQVIKIVSYQLLLELNTADLLSEPRSLTSAHVLRRSTRYGTTASLPGRADRSRLR
ncbi:hypothetical protein RRG08_056558 [Elysia crispata]|uniref:Uncharacterized protein n=1 Tax=Elysia crispata TaxID=231223 RepID=A0AAE0YDK1_9GAST|nr:hypothetical protein RRG08_056558 [Elysia crispata]